MTFPAVDPHLTLAAVAERWTAGRRTNIAFPGAYDLGPLIDQHFAAAGLWSQLGNNIGSPYDDGHGHDHSKPQERQVVDLLADMFGAPASRWGYVTSGSTESTLHALYDAKQQLPGLVVYTSADAHYSVVKLCVLLRLPWVIVEATDDGRIDLADLGQEMGRRRDQPAMVVATAGTTITEGCDDVAAIADLCHRYARGRWRLHVDAALAGPPLGLLPASVRPAFDFAAGATSIGISGHKSLSTCDPCGVIVYAEPPYAAARAQIAYTGTADVTMSGSRSARTPLKLWLVLNALGADGHRERFDVARQVAAYAHDRLRTIGVAAERNPHAFTVYFPPPPAGLTERWAIATDRRYGHIICMPGIEPAQVDEFARDWAKLLPKSRRLVRPRRPAAHAEEPVTVGGTA
ncbi:pyridoxal-dependent decarboxylase [Hamadaea tsunoensis]|uniref:pyridoxal-dependent decarboxylase n=1 Tax=Hamadaea tsunoensis TaxID=53368 RepID=UPI00041940E1|nr:pyridoxal-dependent decarboxylase [Hamadaea tsunoensis]